MTQNKRKLKHNGFEILLDRVVVGYKVQSDRFVRSGASKNTMQRYGYEYRIQGCSSPYNTGKLLKDWKYILENLKHYQWIKPYLK